MNHLKFQVTIFDKKGYILGYSNFEWIQMEQMLQFISFRATSAEANKVEITRWNKKTGERE